MASSTADTIKPFYGAFVRRIVVNEESCKKWNGPLEIGNCDFHNKYTFERRETASADVVLCADSAVAFSQLDTG